MNIQMLEEIAKGELEILEGKGITHNEVLRKTSFWKQDLDHIEQTFQKEKSLAKPVTHDWIRKAHVL